MEDEDLILEKILAALISMIVGVSGLAIVAGLAVKGHWPIAVLVMIFTGWIISSISKILLGRVR